MVSKQQSHNAHYDVNEFMGLLIFSLVFPVLLFSSYWGSSVAITVLWLRGLLHTPGFISCSASSASFLSSHTHWSCLGINISATLLDIISKMLICLVDSTATLQMLIQMLTPVTRKSCPLSFALVFLLVRSCDFLFHSTPCIFSYGYISFFTSFTYF